MSNAQPLTPKAVRLQMDPAHIERSWPLLCAPLVAVLAGVAAEWLDVRALRYPLLLMVGGGVLATALALFGRDRGTRAFLLTVVLGAATWAAAETLYVIIHAARGGSFDAERFGPQWALAFGLIGVHALFLGVPTGLAAATLRDLVVRYRT
ncbi:MAG: hypothetical protein WEB52_01900 [Dehalococcoidia bacterium]